MRLERSLALRFPVRKRELLVEGVELRHKIRDRRDLIGVAAGDVVHVVVLFIQLR